MRYIHTSMIDLSVVPDESVDFVWAGASIEHVTIAEAQQVYAEVKRVLKPGAYFCLDTANRSVTRLKVPHSYTDPEHKYEYRVSELLEHLRQAGFVVQRTLGICPMPRTVNDQCFYTREMVQEEPLSTNPEISYMFYVECVKTAQ